MDVDLECDESDEESEFEDLDGNLKVRMRSRSISAPEADGSQPSHGQPKRQTTLITMTLPGANLQKAQGNASHVRFDESGIRNIYKEEIIFINYEKYVV